MRGGPVPSSASEAISPGAEQDQLRRRIAAAGPWFHNMELGGVWTAPEHFLGDYPAVTWRALGPALPADLRGRTVLDIGCNAGFHSLEMKRRGAARVVAIDSDPDYLAQARLAAEVTGLDIELRQLSVYDVADLGQRFDIVLFMGVLYHLRHPLLALDLIHAHVADDLLVFQSMQRGSSSVGRIEPDHDFQERAAFDAADWPKLHFIEGAYAGDCTNWWVPNAACSLAMLRSAGFMPFASPDPEIHLCRRIELPEPPEGPRAVHPSRGSPTRAAS